MNVLFVYKIDIIDNLKLLQHPQLKKSALEHKPTSVILPTIVICQSCQLFWVVNEVHRKKHYYYICSLLFIELC